MESYVSPFAFLLLGWGVGFLSSFVLMLLSRVLFPAKEIDKFLG